MIAPFAGKSSYRLTSKFGYRTLDKGKEKHNGLDFVSYYKKEVIAVDNGTVIAIITNSYNMDTANPRGNYVKIKTSDGKYILYYQHLASVSVKVGDTISIGDELGIEGNTGRVWSANGGTGIHLHFEVRDANTNEAINPANVYDIYNKVGDYNPSDEFVREGTDKEYIEDQNNQNDVKETNTESDIKYTDELDGKYEPIYPDLTISPDLLTKQYNGKVKITNYIDPEIIKNKRNTGIIANNNKPYNVDNYIDKLESHSPNIVLNSTNVDRLKDNMPIETDDKGIETNYSIQNKNKLLELVESIDKLSKSVEKRVVRLENIESTTMRYLYRLSSRIKVNCVYYGGQSVYNKYLCIRCLDDDLVNDTPVSLDQCLNCSRYEPIEGQVYELDDKTYLSNTDTDNSIIIDNSQAERESISKYINQLNLSHYNDNLNKISKKVIDTSTEKQDNVEIRLLETTLSEQIPNISKYEIDNIVSQMPEYSDNNVSSDTTDTAKEESNISEATNIASFELPILNSNNILVPSKRIVQVMADYETFKATKYKDGLDPKTGKQMYSIGFGHQILDTDDLVEPISYQKAMDLLFNDSMSKARLITNNMKRAGLLYNIRQCELDALVCFTCSCGGRSAVTTAAIEYIKNKTSDNEKKLYDAWTSNGIYYAYYEKGKRKSKLLQPLVERRKREFKIFTKGDYSK